MLIKFKIIFEDNTFLESHDSMFNQIKDHCHALPPFNNKKWKRYELITDEGQFVWVDFNTGLFCINGQIIHPAEENGVPLTNHNEKQNFGSIAGREILNGLNYYPIFGKSRIFGDWGNVEIHFCGWKIKVGNKTIQKTIAIYPTGAIVMT